MEMYPYFDYQFRVIIIGNSMVGKSTFLRTFAEGNFSKLCDPTVGVDFFSRTISMPNSKYVKLQLWDTAGHEKFRYYWNQLIYYFLDQSQNPITGIVLL